MGGTRRAGLRVQNIALPVRGADVEDFAQQARRNPISDGRIVSVTFASATTAQVRHALGRLYVGAIVIGQTEQHTQSISAVDPATWVASGNDGTVYLGVQAGGAGGATYTGTVTLWVF